MAHHHTAGRTSSKRSATALPSPSTPSSLELPPKIARLGLEQHDEEDDIYIDDDDRDIIGRFPEESDSSKIARLGFEQHDLDDDDMDIIGRFPEESDSLKIARLGFEQHDLDDDDMDLIGRYPFPEKSDSPKIARLGLEQHGEDDEMYLDDDDLDVSGRHPFPEKSDPPKIARLGLEQHGEDDEMYLDDDDLDVIGRHPFREESDMYIDDDDRDVIGRFPEESDWALSSSEDDSTPFSPSSPHTSVSDEMSASRLSLFSRDRPTPATSMEALALSQPASTTASPDAPPTFLTLPPEIRHQIYRYLPDLVRPTPLIYCLSTFANNLQHPLASVSPLVRAEALAIFYSYNTWVIKLEFRMMYEAFHAWIIRLGPGAASLRLVHISVRGSLFKPRTRHHPIVIFPVLAGHSANTGAQRAVEDYHPPDGDASFKIDLSEKYAGGKVELVRCDGSRENGEKGRVHLEKLVAGLWGKRRAGTLNGQDWVDAVDSFLAFTGWW